MVFITGGPSNINNINKIEALLEKEVPIATCIAQIDSEIQTSNPFAKQVLTLLKEKFSSLTIETISFNGFILQWHILINDIIDDNNLISIDLSEFNGKILDQNTQKTRFNNILSGINTFKLPRMLHAIFEVDSTRMQFHKMLHGFLDAYGQGKSVM